MRVLQVPIFQCVDCLDSYDTHYELDLRKIIFTHLSHPDLINHCPKEGVQFIKSFADLSIEVL